VPDLLIPGLLSLSDQGGCVAGVDWSGILQKLGRNGRLPARRARYNTKKVYTNRGQ